MKILSRKYNSLEVLGDNTSTCQNTRTDMYATNDGGRVLLSDINFNRECRRKGFGRYAKFIIKQDVSSHISNIVISGGGDLTASLTKNAKQIFEALSRKGYLFFKVENNVFTILDDSEVTDTSLKIFDPTFSKTLQTPRDTCAADIIDFINDLENVENTLINQAEASDIFTPKETPIVSAEKINNFTNKLRGVFGLKSYQSKTAFVETPLEHHSIGRYDYQISDKIKFQFQKLCKLYMYPEDLYFANTTFDNKSDARLQLCLNYAGYFYDVISQILEQVITRYTINDISIDFYNITEWEEARAKKIENVKETIRFFLELKQNGFDTAEKINQLIKEL